MSEISLLDPDTILFILLIITGSILVSFSIIGIYHQRVRGAIPFAGLSFSIAIYTIFYAFEIISPSLGYALLWNKIQYIGIATIPPWTLIFALQFTGYKPGSSLFRIISPWIIPAAIILLKFTDQYHGLINKEVSASITNGILILDITPGIGYWINVIYINAMLLTSVLVFSRELRRSGSPMLKKQVLIMLAGILVPWIAHIFYQAGWSLYNTDISPYGFTVTAIVMGYVIFSFGLFETNTIVSEQVTTGLTDGIIITDLNYYIVDTNNSARQSFGTLFMPLHKTRLEVVFNGDPEMLEFLKSENDDSRLNIHSKGMLRSYLVKRSMFRDPSGIPSGYVYIFKDITREVETEEALKAKTREPESFFANSLDLLCVFNHEGKIVHVNPVWEQKTGYSKEILTGKTIFEFVHSEEREGFIAKFKDSIEKGGAFNYLTRFRALTGNFLWFEWSINAGGTRLYASIRDITIRIHEQEMLGNLVKFSEDFMQLPSGFVDYKLIFDNFFLISSASNLVMLVYTDNKQVYKPNAIIVSKKGKQTSVQSFQPEEGFSVPEFKSLSGSFKNDSLVKITLDDINRRGVAAEYFPIKSGVEIYSLIIPDSGRISGEFIFTISNEKLIERKRYLELFAQQTGMLMARRDVERKTKNEKLYFENLFESSPAGIVLLDSGDRIKRCNESFLRMFGYLQSEVLNNPINDLIVPDHLKEEGSSITNSVARGETIQHKTIRCKKSGDLIDVSILNKPIEMENGEFIVYGIYIDITDQVHIENMLKQGQAELQNTLDLQRVISDIAIALNERRNFDLRINAVLETTGKAADVSRVYIFENDADNAYTSNIYEWCAENVAPQKDKLQSFKFSDIESFRNRISEDGCFISGDISLVEDNFRKTLERQSIKAMVVYPLWVSNRFFGFIGYDECRFTRDWTNPELELLKTVSAIISNSYERQLIELTLIEERDKANRANISKSEFLANMSHEIRTPMNAILGFSETLIEKLDEPEHKKMLNIILSSGRTLLTLLNDILDISKIESGKLEISTHSISLPKLIEEIIMLFQDEADRKNIGISFIKSELFPQVLLLDDLRVKQVLFNLIGNAVKFTDHGYVSVTSKFERTTDSSGNMIVKVKDTGIGIAQEKLECIFDTFIQATGSILSGMRHEGTGLGLSISKRLVEKMNGYLTVESNVGVGSEFTMILKGVSYSDAVKEKLHGKGGLDKINFNGATAVVIDDSESNLLLIEEIFRNLGIMIYKATEGQKGLELINRIIPDIIIVDLRMPGINGFEVAEEIRSNPSTAHIPVIAYTAALIELKGSNKAHLFNGVFVKPVNTKDIIEELRKNLLQTNTSKTIVTNNPLMNSEELDASIAKSSIRKSELSNLLQNQFMPKYEEIKDQLVLNKIEAFANELKQIAISFNFAYMESYAGNLLNSVNNLDLDQIQELLGIFPAITEKITGTNNKLY